MALIRGTSRGPHPSLPPLLIPQEETLAPSRGPSWRFEKPWPGGGLVLGAGGAGLSARIPCLRRGACTLLPEPWWLEQGLPLSMDSRHFVQGWPGIPLFPGLDLPTPPPGLGWDYLAGPQPHPYPCWQGQGSQLAFLASSILCTTYNCRAPQQGNSAGLDGAHWSKPLETDTSGQVWQLAPPQAGGSRLGPSLQDHIALIDLPLIPLLCQGQWALHR